jgi:hypothetical protein
MTEQLKSLIELFAFRSRDPSTLMELHRMLSDRTSWHAAYDLFDRIRKKNIDHAKAHADLALLAQYQFEEACAKTLYNLTGEPAPFDAHAPYWIVPSALTWAQFIGLDVGEVIKIVSSGPADSGSQEDSGKV